MFIVLKGIGESEINMEYSASLFACHSEIPISCYFTGTYIFCFEIHRNFGLERTLVRRLF